MNYFLTNWKTTLAGLGGLFTALGSLLTDLSSGNTDHLLGYTMAIVAAGAAIFGRDWNANENTGIAGPRQ